MKTKKLPILLFTFFILQLLPSQSFSQIYPGVNGKPDDYKQMKGRTLIVELMEEDAKKVEKLTKKNKTNELTNYRKAIADYNEKIKVAVTKYWTFNKNIEYKTSSEVEQIDRKEQKNYDVMYYKELEDQGSPVYPSGGGAVTQYNTSSLSIPMIAYSKLENRAKIADDMAYLPPMNIPESYNTPLDWTYMQCSFNFAVRELLAVTEYVIKTDKKTIYEDYAEKMSETGKCEKLKQSDILISKNHLVKNANIKDIQQPYTKASEFVDDTVINNAFVNEVAGKSVMFVVPYGISKPSHSAMNSFDELGYFKLVIDCKTGDVLYLYKSNREFTWYVNKPAFEEMEKCK